MHRVALLACLAASLSGCAYLRTSAKQALYAARQYQGPLQRTFKHMLDRDTFFVFGKIAHLGVPEGAAIAVVALSDSSPGGEVVDANHFSRGDSYYGLHLPQGDYRLLVMHDRNGDRFYEEGEAIGGRSLSLDPVTTPDKVLGGYDIDLAGGGMPGAGVPSRIAVREPGGLSESLFYPKGTIRPLHDEIFSPRMAALGLYEPAAFLEEAPMMFYALEEDQGHKIPVVFVHGVGGSPRDFEAILARLDRSRYRPWFFYYPSGTDLDQLGEMFYRLFLSGSVIPLGEMPLALVAHSMGGLVVRDALNRCAGREGEARVQVLVTIASPLGGIPVAGNAAAAPVVISSWRDVDPQSPFVRRLHRRPLPSGLAYHLLYAYGNSGAIKLGKNSDGVVPLSSQLSAAAQKEALRQHGFNETHTGVLREPDLPVETAWVKFERVRAGRETF